MSGNVVPLTRAPAAPSSEQLLARIRAMVDAGQVRWDDPHFRQRLELREINMRQVTETLKKGDAVGAPRIDQWGDWRLKLKRKVAGRRVQVVVAVKADHFVCVTVM